MSLYAPWCLAWSCQLGFFTPVGYLSPYSAVALEFKTINVSFGAVLGEEDIYAQVTKINE